jgi:hypothetical protein
MFDNFVKSSSAALRFILSHCGVRQVRLIPLDLRALHLELFTLLSAFDFLRARQYLMNSRGAAALCSAPV